MKLGILGAGNIARKMAATVNEMEHVEAHAVASRDLQKAREFAQKWNVRKAYGSYEEMLSDPEIDLVYVCTPHSLHFEHMMMCLDKGKHVLCEKSFTMNAEQARKVLAYGREKKLLVAEAIWTRYLPMRLVLDQILERRVIGEPHALTANLCYPVKGVKRLTDPALAGGALLDVGVYPINFAMMVFGNNIESIESSCIKTDSGVDESNSITLTFKGDKMAVLHSSMVSTSDRRGAIFGTRGFIEFLNINNCEGINVYDKEYNLVETYKPFKFITGFEHQVEACRKAIEEGALECKQMPHSEIIKVMEVMDTLRSQWGIRFPGE
ncbi:MAG: Gfo/Idh/MocA family protein [Sphaerochaeta sp.]|jgi:predicted dehydrogenase|uniref:Gfo/Idh/MocA family protein n=1 Tax=unclassified Sphaerochaeta TaxID=2637943 RepID=UPI0025E09FF9|nr:MULTISPECIES: Gfo/Idh/MocA family oxidoreductase [unclassified Sphaerochaeta]MDX9825297.1 Gfo/Idh/MocA family oxidoreductase [Sphaerochaeta sp.]